MFVCCFRDGGPSSCSVTCWKRLGAWRFLRLRPLMDACLWPGDEDMWMDLVGYSAWCFLWKLRGRWLARQRCQPLGPCASCDIKARAIQDCNQRCASCASRRAPAVRPACTRPKSLWPWRPQSPAARTCPGWCWSWPLVYLCNGLGRSVHVLGVPLLRMTNLAYFSFTGSAPFYP